MSEPNPEPELPLVSPVGPAPPPLVLPVEPPKLARPRPGFLEACILTLGYWVCLIGPILLIVLAAVIWQAVVEHRREYNLTAAFAWSMPAGYVGGLLFAVGVLYFVIGRGWVRELGFLRVPPLFLLLGLIALPGFSILSDTIAGLFKPIDDLVFRLTGIGELGDTGKALQTTYQDYHWIVAVFAVGIMPGLVEELWCRGFLGRGFIHRYGWVGGVALASLFFGVLHLFPPSYVITTAVMGAGLHFAYITSRSLWVSVMMHLVNNSFAVLVAIKVIPSERMEAAMGTRPVPILAAAVCVLVFAGLAMWQSRARLEGTGDPAKYRGIMVPPADSGLRVVHPRPQLLLTLAAAGFSVTLLALLFG